MSNTLKNLKPKQLWENFEKICEIPHPSKHEKQIADFVVKVGREVGLETIIDKVGNVIIRKPATSGAGGPGVILQSHLDMVPQKDEGVDHDFQKDAIKPYVDGEWVKARGTTLGADNGIGVAAMLAILQSKDIKHGSLEAVFTVNEEEGLTGAFGFEAGVLQGKTLLNLDAEDDGEFCIGCAGGAYTLGKINYTEISTPDSSSALKIRVFGLHGGHSAVDIHRHRGNANKILNRLLWEASKRYDVHLAKVYGGELMNAIAREAYAIVTVSADQKEGFSESLHQSIALIKNEFAAAESNLKLEIAETKLPEKVIDEKTQKAVLNLIYGLPNGVIEMSPEVDGLVETSTNLSKIRLADGIVEISTFQRSMIDSAKHSASDQMKSVFLLAGASVEQKDVFPSWQPDKQSRISRLMEAVYLEKFGQKPKITATHGGLECGIFKGLYPDLDAIAFGPTIQHAHSPREMVHIPAVEKFWELLIAVLERV